VDDLLVAVSSAGDVLVYEGTDPASPSTFDLKGDWSIGALPAGRRIATDFGGDLLVLSLLGVVSLTKLVAGSTGAATPDQYATYKIHALFHQYAQTLRSMRGWSIRLHPDDNVLLVNTPPTGGKYEQLASSLTTQSWSVFQGLPLLSSELWRGKLYIGTPDGRVCLVTGGEDDGSPVEWSGQTAFQPGAQPTRMKLEMIQPLIIASGPQPGIEVSARYDFDTSAVKVTPPSPDESVLSLWDTAHWDAAYWPGADLPYSPWRGAFGNGRYMSLAFRGRSSDRAILVGFNVRFTSGGIL
jgi:hypothetical protein